jgi:predicted RecA/RadA family phage recombinase
MKKTFLSLAAVLAVGLAAAAANAAGIDAAGVSTAVSSWLSANPDVATGLAGLGAFGTTKAYQEGKVIDWVNGTGADVTSNTVVRIGNILGIALTDIADGDTGSVAIEGVFTCPKVSAAVIAQGESLTWDASASAFDDNAATPATGDVTGAPAVAFEAAGNGVTELKVKFTGTPGTVT